jgi:formamidopyrimidine-DNA glycosylase
MPELPELEIVREVLDRRVVGQTVDTIEVLPPAAPIVLRDLTQLGFVQTLTGAVLTGVARRGKFLLLELQSPLSPEPLYLVINPKLTGRLQLAEAKAKRYAKTAFVLALSSGRQLRYFDDKMMGQVYLVRRPDQAVGFAEMGPEAMEVTREEFRARLRPFRGEIKGILINAAFVAGIGNAYADEILWAAQLHPYRKRTQLTPAEIDRLYDAMGATLADAIQKLRVRMGEQTHLEPRDFFAVHLRGGEACPRCGASIAEVTANQRITNFCRACQPGGLLRGMG